MTVRVVLKGLVKKEDISSIVDLKVEYAISHRKDFTIIDVEGEDEEIFHNFLKQKYEIGHLMGDLNLNTYQGRLIDVGKYGFGVFCDIGAEKDVLISLNSLREVFGGKRSTREYIFSKGLIEGLCLDVDLVRIERGTGKIWGSINMEWSQRYLQDRNITVSKVAKDQLMDLINGTSFKSTLEVMDLCKDSFIVKCGEGIDPPGIVHIIGSKLPKARLGIVGEI